MLIAAPSDAANPTSRAACEPARKAVAKIGDRVEMVPSMSPINDGWTKRRIWAGRPCARQRWSRSPTVRTTTPERLAGTVSTEVAATDHGSSITVSCRVAMTREPDW
jgi:hypothetical protein